MNLEELEAHFRFGDNWQSYARTITEGHIRHAVAGLRELLPDGCAGETFLDIGSGSGIHSLAASILEPRSRPSISTRLQSKPPIRCWPRMVFPK